uniref:3-methyl-2-oxobutanoate hydroxymethyltransferase n=1 Tax=Arcella intermedia TaxID=1963864 RepID=A0A6B2KZ10_9EUKA
MLDFKEKYEKKVPITMVTAYDYTSARFADQVGIDSLLVGDSFAMVMNGNESTSTATVDEVIYHCKAVTRGAPSSFVVADMPFGSYEICSDDAVKNAIRLIKEGNAHAVKLEGGKRMASRVKAIVDAGIPVMGHIGLTPQSLNALGGFKVQGKTAEAAVELLKDAYTLQESGCFAMVIESVPARITDYITKNLRVPTIGIGGGKFASGQILVWHDMFGLFQDFTPKFCKQYGNLGKVITEGLQKYKEEVEAREFPAKEHSYIIKNEEWDKFAQILKISPDKAPAVPAAPPPAVPVAPLPAVPAAESGGEAGRAGEGERKAEGVREKAERKEQVDLKGRRKKKVLILGGGSMGSLVASQVMANNENVNSPFHCDVWVLSTWDEHVKQIRSKGLTVEDLNGEERVLRGINAVVDPKDVVGDGVLPDVIIVLVKSPYTAKAAERIKEIFNSNPNSQELITIITLQNGIGNLEILQTGLEEFKQLKLKFVHGVTDQAALITSPGKVRHTGQGCTTIAGDTKNEEDRVLGDILNHGGMRTTLHPDVSSVAWGKLVLNAAINPITALLGVENGKLVDGTNSRARSMLIKALMEAVQVAEARGVVLPYSDPIQKVESVAELTAKNKSSMLVDLQRGEPTEIDSINGVIVDEGTKLGIDVAMNRFLLKNIKNCVEAQKTIY